MIRLKTDLSDLRRNLKLHDREANRRIERLLHDVGRRTIEILRGYTGETKGPSHRPVHPGGWADRTRELRDAYRYEVERASRGWMLVIINDDEKAHLVEDHDGLYVVRGVTHKNGPVYQALRQAMKDIAPDWSLS